MAPAIVHFLVGAALVLLMAAPLALRGGVSRNQLWLVAIGGLWGLFPDLSHVTPVFQGSLYRFHESGWADLFAFHQTLDKPPIDTHPLESTAVAILFFLGAVFVFSAASAAGERDERVSRTDLVTRALVTCYAVVITATIAGIVVGSVVTETGRIESLAALAGREGHHAGWALLLFLALAATGAFAVLVAIVDVTFPIVGVGWSPTNPVSSSVLGLFFAVAAWSVVVTIAVPLWMRVGLDLTRPIPYVHWPSLFVLLGFGFILGVLYPLVRRFISPSASPPTA